MTFRTEWSASFWRRVERGAPEECWPWLGVVNNHGRPVMSPTLRRKVSASRFSYWLHVGSIPSGAVICHRCDNPVCVNPAHLFAGTQIDNLADMTAKGRRVGTAISGERNGRSRISDAQCAVIAARLAGEGPSALAREYGVDRTTIYRAAARASCGVK